MQVILTKEVLGLGDPGQVVKVKDGYGRNYLIPQGFAIEASKNNMTAVKAETARIAASAAAEAERVAAEAAKVQGAKVVIKARAGDSGKLYGSVTNMDIAKALAEQGLELDRRRIMMAAPIKELGDYTLKVKFHPQVIPTINVVVEAEITEEDRLIAEARAADRAKAKAKAAAQAEEGGQEAEEEAADKE